MHQEKTTVMKKATAMALTAILFLFPGHAILAADKNHVDEQLIFAIRSHNVSTLEDLFARGANAIL